MHRSTALILALLLSLLALPASGQLLRVYYPDIEQGSSTLVVSPTGQAILIDAGTGLGAAEDGIEDFINDLIDAGIVTSLDYTLVTHYDEDHIGRMENVFQMVPLSPTSIAYDRGEFGSVPSTFAYGDYSFGAGMFNRTTITATTTLDLGGGVFVDCYVVNGSLPDSSSVDISGSGQFENSASVAVVVRYDDVDIWIGGDLTGNEEVGVTDVESSVAPFAGDVDVYTFNHHGSRTSSTQSFLTTLAAEVGINQNSASNTFGHPNTEVVNRFLATDDTGGNSPFFFQQNPGNPTDTRSDDNLADGIADCDDVDGAYGLPGTLTLLSDGTSYQISACGIPATTFAADAGPGTLGDYPPAVRRVLRTPLVPLATEAVTVEADAEDEGTVSLELRYSLDGIDQTPVPMTLSSGITYTASIPAQLDGTRVRFRVAATDNLSQTTLGAAQGYFSGTTDIATLRLNDADGVLVPKTYGVRVRGNMTAEDGIFHSFVTLAYVQDATGGVQIFNSTLLSGVIRGDEVEFVGHAEQFGGQTEVNVAGTFGNVGYTLIGPGTVPAPQVITVAQAGESLEGQLIRINNVSVISGTIPESGSDTLTISDDGGISTLDLRIDGDTDIPGANTPTLGFDLIGILSQFDSWVPLTSGYQILPRERTDFLSDEVNHPQVLISEIHADPANGPAGDANGDGTRNATQDEFIELINTGFTAFDISGYTLSDGGGLRHTFAGGTVIPAREAVVVFGGGTPTGDFGNAMANGLVFTASSGGLSLNNTGDTVTLADDQGATVQVVTYGSEANSNESIVRDPDWTNAPFVQHTGATGSGGALYSPGTRISGQAYTVAQGAVLLTEVMANPSGSDDGLEWFELYNTTATSIDLSALCVGNGGGEYTNSLVSLSGTLAAGATYVVGGPTSDANNGNPVFDLVVNFSPDFQNGGSTADGVALFNTSCAQVDASLVPIDAVVYGDTNSDGFLDETGVANAPEVGAPGSGQSLERIDNAGIWHLQAVPTPGNYTDGGPPPPPAGLILSEVYYNAPSGDDGFEWVELYNSGTEVIDLAQFSLGNGGADYTTSTVQLSGTLAPGEIFVVGGPTSDGTNGNPTFDLVVNFSPDFQNAGSTADGVALFNVPENQVTSVTVPIDAVVYGTTNSNGLIDETGVANAPEVGTGAAGESMERVDLAGVWQIQSTPNPNSSPLTGGGNTAPFVTITSPSSGTSYTDGDTVSFTGSATDAEDGDLAANLAWDSDLDGSIGNGASFSTSTLSVGTHLITASVTDSGGLQGTDTITVIINPTGGGGITLSANGYKVKGVQHADLTWSGATSTDVDVFRDGNLVVTTPNDGAHTDNIGAKGGGSYDYQVCEAGTATCSNTVQVVF